MFALEILVQHWSIIYLACVHPVIYTLYSTKQHNSSIHNVNKIIAILVPCLHLEYVVSEFNAS